MQPTIETLVLDVLVGPQRYETVRDGLLREHPEWANVFYSELQERIRVRCAAVTDDTGRSELRRIYAQAHVDASDSGD